MVDAAFLLLRILHVGSAALWLGGGLFHVAVVAPLLRQSTPLTRREFSGRLMPANLRYHNILGGLTFLTGLLLLWRHPRGGLDLPLDPWERAIVVAIVAALLALYLVNTGMRVTIRTIQKVTDRISPEMETPATLRFLHARLAFSTGLVLAILVLALGFMSYANLA